MCGFAGYYCKDLELSEDDFKKAVGKLSHRGPDAEDFYFSQNGKLSVGMGHRRLSIIDLSEAANQPFFSSCGNYVIVFNGEIYNYRELQKDISVELKTKSDTEVILELFIKFGPDFVHKLNGMFTFAIYDIVNERMFLFRDRLGVKPLYYFWDENNLFFGSELKALTSINAIKTQLSISKTAISHFLHLGYIPEPLSIYDQIQKFPAASYAVIDNRKFNIVKYWNPVEPLCERLQTSYIDIKQELNAILESSIQYRMISDVPFGTFLSGGVDSSLVTAIASKHSTEKLKTFSIGFNEKKFDESKYAREIASYLQTDHHELIVSEQDALDSFEFVMDNFDEPYADTSALPSYLVSKMASKHVKMVLTGDGGDELFMGYGSYRWAERLSNPLIRALKTPVAKIMFKLGDNRLKRVSYLLQRNSHSVHSHIFSQEQYFFTQKEVSQLLIEENISPFSYTISKKTERLEYSSAEEQAFFDLNFYLKDDLLVKVDRTSMLCSLEAREPLLDYKLVEFSLKIPQKFKMDKGESKIILKDILYDYVPKRYFDRPKKGFSIPLGIWMKTELRYLIDDYLAKAKVEETGILNYEYVKNIIIRFNKGEDYLYNRLYVLSTLQRWLLKNKGD